MENPQKTLHFFYLLYNYRKYSIVLPYQTRDTASSFLRKNLGRIFRVAVQCRQQRENRDIVANNTCVMFKVEGRIQCKTFNKYS